MPSPEDETAGSPATPAPTPPAVPSPAPVTETQAQAAPQADAASPGQGPAVAAAAGAQVAAAADTPVAEAADAAESAASQRTKDEELRRVFKEAWQATLGALGNAEEETQALLGRLVALGQISREEGARLYSDTRALVEQRRNELETRVQGAIDAAMKRLTIPTQQDIAEVAQKLAELERRVEALTDLDPNDTPFQHPATQLDKALDKALARRRPSRKADPKVDP